MDRVLLKESNRLGKFCFALTFFNPFCDSSPRSPLDNTPNTSGLSIGRSFIDYLINYCSFGSPALLIPPPSLINKRSKRDICSTTTLSVVLVTVPVYSNSYTTVHVLKRLCKVYNFLIVRLIPPLQSLVRSLEPRPVLQTNFVITIHKQQIYKHILQTTYKQFIYPLFYQYSVANRWGDFLDLAALSHFCNESWYFRKFTVGDPVRLLIDCSKLAPSGCLTSSIQTSLCGVLFSLGM